MVAITHESSRGHEGWHVKSLPKREARYSRHFLFFIFRHLLLSTTCIYAELSGDHITVKYNPIYWLNSGTTLHQTYSMLQRKYNN